MSSTPAPGRSCRNCYGGFNLSAESYQPRLSPKLRFFDRAYGSPALEAEVGAGGEQGPTLRQRPSGPLPRSDGANSWACQIFCLESHNSRQVSPRLINGSGKEIE